MRSPLTALVTLWFAAAAATLPARADTTDNPCTAGLFDIADRPTIVGTPCTISPSAIGLEAGYYQNASHVGATQLAAYPDLRLRVGLPDKVELFADAPSEVAEAAPHGVRRFSAEQAGFGVKWTISDTDRLSYGTSFEITPPNLATSIVGAKERYDAGLDSLYRFTPRVNVGLSVDLDDGHTYGSQIESALAVREGLSLGYSALERTQIISEFATEDGSAQSRAGANSTGDVLIRQELTKRSLFDVEVGTAFDAIHGRSKPHYLGAGFSLKT